MEDEFYYNVVREYEDYRKTQRALRIKRKLEALYNDERVDALLDRLRKEYYEAA